MEVFRSSEYFSTYKYKIPEVSSIEQIPSGRDYICFNAGHTELIAQHTNLLTRNDLINVTNSGVHSAVYWPNLIRRKAFTTDSFNREVLFDVLGMQAVQENVIAVNNLLAKGSDPDLESILLLRTSRLNAIDVFLKQVQGRGFLVPDVYKDPIMDHIETHLQPAA